MKIRFAVADASLLCKKVGVARANQAYTALRPCSQLNLKYYIFNLNGKSVL